MEVKDDNDLISCARLVEAVLDVAEADIYLLSFSRRIPQSILMNLQITDRLFAN